MHSPDTAPINPAIVRSYDIRGEVGKQLTLEDARALGLAFATVAAGKDLRRIAVSRDGRLSSPDLQDSLRKELASQLRQSRHRDR